jgi:flavodoxin
MKIAVVFYSLDGNCALVAEELKAQLNADLIRVQTVDEKKRGKMGMLFWGCGMVFSRKNPPIKPVQFDPSAYDLIIMGAPVWAYSSAPPLLTFISQAGITGKKIALFVCHGGGMGKSLTKLKALLPGNDIVSEIDFKEPINDNIDNVKQKIVDWVKSFKD